MGIETKLKELGIKKILVVDDTPKHVQTALSYLKQLEQYSIQTEGATSAKEAKEKIKESYAKDQKYDLVLSDLQMEQLESGLEVVREGLKHFADCFIVTGRCYKDSHHGPTTTLMPTQEVVSGRKDQEKVWEALLKKAVHYMEGKGKSIRLSLKKYGKYVGIPFEGPSLDIMVRMYKL
ncbi:hypothetical protein AYK26_04235 [Euryarchaeota archaeon SM23-78]|nr:MAG: hypothetical protein AYK26_04235 [Euryarchaeota archaeon SM23-78]MBW3001273.1 response regulator [Candidatus Woesearchaeota archaeon]